MEPRKKHRLENPLVGHGQSSPIIWNGHIYVTAIDGPKKEQCLVFCYDLASGNLVWKYSLTSSDPVENSLYVSRAAPTPTADEHGLYVFFESGDVVALSHDGKELWKRSLSQEYGKFQNKFGIGSSPTQTTSGLFILVDDEGPSFLIALDKKSGKNLWKQERTARKSWSSPAIVQLEGKPCVVVSSDGSVDGYAADSGELLWSFTDVGGNTGTTPIDLGAGKFLVAASAGRDGGSPLAKKSNLLMQVKKQDSKWAPSPLWISSEASPSWASPIAHAGCAYWINSQGVVFCHDIESGKLHYSKRTKQSCWATPIAVEDRIYFFGKDGTTTILKAGPEFEVIAENQLWDPDAVQPDPNAGANEPTEERRRAAAMFAKPTVYGVAISRGSIVVRTGTQMFCIK